MRRFLLPVMLVGLLLVVAPRRQLPAALPTGSTRVRVKLLPFVAIGFTSKRWSAEEAP